ncbi:MAG TPA: hydantoinase/oxoprolinase family protein [Solirubrobacterales bacterium]|nr:hydantoinase/oxoprolinase family protein [Solirubrobacterales bacterium]
MAYRITVDVGGTFTDVVLTDEQGDVRLGKSPTTPERAFDGIRGGLEVIAGELDAEVDGLLAETELFVYSTTRATNAIIEQKTASTAFLTTAGFPDILVLREGGKASAFDYETPYPDPYVPRRLTFEVPERIDAEGVVQQPLDEEAAGEIAARLGVLEVEAVAVCLLWSIVNPAHELRLGEILAAALPDASITLSHQLSPVLREYRRASTTAIDASLKPMMGAHIRAVADDLAAAGFAGELLGATSFGGVMHLDDLAARPVYSAKSGPALAPVAGRVYGEAELGARDVVVCDMGGTSFDVSLVLDGAVNFTRTTWLGGQFVGHLIATSSVDVRSIGAGGGSIAWIDPGGLLRVGPESAGAVPGPACYGRDGDRATVTDAALHLGYLDPDGFLGGRMTLDTAASERVVAALGDELGVSADEAAAAVLTVANDHMYAAVAEITVNEGLDPRDSLLVAGGGAAGLTIGRIAAEFGCRHVLVPRTAGALSAMGGQFSDVVAEFSETHLTDTREFDFAGVEEVLEGLDARAAEFAARLHKRGIEATRVEYAVEARYAYQVWDLEMSLPLSRVRDAADVKTVAATFDALHERVYTVSQPGHTVELLTWKARLIGDLEATEKLLAPRAESGGEVRRRRAYFPETGWTDVEVHDGATLAPGAAVAGPALIAEPSSTLVVYPGMTAQVTDHDNYLVLTGEER